MSGRYKAGTGGVNTGKQRTYCGAYSAENRDDNTGKVLGDVSYPKYTRDKIRAGADHPDLGTYPGPTPNNYVSGDGFKMSIKLTHPDVDPDGSRALQKDWHRRAGFSRVVSATENEQGGTHPSRGTDARTRMRSGWGADNDTAGQGSPKKAPFSWQ